MENATKALLIAAAILVAIIIISIGIAVVNKGQEAVSDADLSAAQADAFNAKFKVYEGTNVSTTDVRALLSTVFAHNQSERNGNFVTVTGVTALAMSENSTSIPQVTGNSRYTVALGYSNGIVNQITLTQQP